MTTEQLQEAVKRLSNIKQHDKSSLHYIIKAVSHAKYFYSYEESKNRAEWLEALTTEIAQPEPWNKLVKLNGFQDLA